MLKVWRIGLLLAVGSCLLVSNGALAAQEARGSLVDVRWLEKNLDSSSLLILDASPAQAYTAQHIPGAVNVDVFTYGAQEKPLAEMERLLQSWGVSPGKTIVLYDQGGTFLATRALYTLLYYGVPPKDLCLLDGGMYQWQQAGLPVTRDPTSPARGSFRITRADEDVRVRLPEFLNASADTGHTALLEALGADWHFGEVAPFGRPGHPPFGLLLPAADMFNPDKTFKSPEELRRMLAYLGIGPEQRVFTYCGGGIAASVPFFALKFILGYPAVKLFVESELGYVSDERELPYWTYDAPFLMRATAWLQGWGGQMMRTYLPPKMSIVDVRPAGVYGQGHVPYAINIPAEVFRSNVRNPETLATLLGAAGVDPSLEAVVVSGAGVTPDSALAFLVLEELGQRKVSIFADSLDRAAQLGLALSTDPTIVGARKTPRDLAVPPAAYAVRLRKGVMIADSKDTQGLYPTVFIASGRSMPASVPEGKVVRVPYDSLLNSDGTPKAANEIWQVLTKAGVPRYGELVCFSNDPGEAAVSYFILKLMGYPDIKVLVR